MATRKTKGKSKAKAPPFAMMPKAMIQSRGYRSLSFVARGVLVELLAQYNGDNNGDLSATRTMAEEWGIGAPVTLQKALKELERRGWIIQTRTSIFSRHGAKCALYALSWLPIDECPGKDLEVGPTKAPPTPLPRLINSISSCSESEHVPVQKVNT
ncbi:TPA: helix-turn-helix domain-containing protein [Pseudomonas aeruginosa]|uniref:helix-turn-helix domain-containing protein n=1 Tax=Pseudomonas aeruginosa TaxID=287 RepID=UPI001E429538|nr:helix-turn-helix domain-containing protein [Pseudomonas aeruginosa]MDI3626918.1 helix-turn-helix domain-containing protein [Pseudomonas aeruginosa]MDS1041577.1 helix-turn-helix domain-containing protein [Pseudomonas aeruginosa]UFM81859.1 helix-turn-helix domain-containing protein [Pseudomonas aeruginosa]